MSPHSASLNNLEILCGNPRVWPSRDSIWGRARDGKCWTPCHDNVRCFIKDKGVKRYHRRNKASRIISDSILAYERIKLQPPDCISRI